jgi:uncharacterized membrane protein
VTPQEALQLVVWTIAAFGVIIIVLGAIVAFLQYAKAYLDRKLDEIHRRLDIIRIRERFTSRIIFGLDFLIASDIIISVVVPSIEDIARLGGIVVIRTVLTYIISKETQELDRREEWEREHGHDAVGATCPGKHISHK